MAERISGLSIGLTMDDASVRKSLSSIKDSFREVKSSARVNLGNIKFGTKDIKSYKGHVDELTKTYDQQKKNVSALKSEHDLLVASGRENTQEGQRLRTEYNKQAAELNLLGDQMDQAKNGLHDLYVESSSFTKVGNVFSSVGNQMQSVGGTMRNLGGTMTRYITMPAMGVIAAAGGITAAFGWSRLVGLDSAQAQLKGLGYDTEAVGRISDQVTSAIEGGMTTMAEGTAIAAGAMAAGVEEGAELEKYIKLVGDAAVGSNRPVNEMASIFNRVQGTGKLMTQELNMIEDGMPGFSQAMADNLGVSQEEFRKMVTAGEVSSEDFLTVMDDFAGGMAVAYSDSWQGMLANTKAYIGIIGENLLSGVFEQSKDSIAEFIELLKSEEAQAWAADMGVKIGEAFSKIVNAVKGAINWFMNLSASQQKLIGIFSAVAIAAGPILTVLGSMIIFIGSVVSALAPFILGLGKLSGGIKVVMSGLKPFAAVFPKLAGFMGLLTGPVGLVIAAIAALGAGFVLAYNKSAAFRNFIDVLKEKFVAFIPTIVQFGKNIYDNFMNLVIPAVQAVKGFFLDMFSQIKQFWQSDGQQVINAITNGVNIVKAVVSVAMPIITSIINVAFKLVLTVVKMVWDNIKGVIQGGLNIIMGLVKVFAGIFTGDFSKMWEGVKQIFVGAFQFVWNAFQLMFWGRIIKGITAFIKGGLGLFRNFGTQTGNVFTSMWQSVVRILTNLWNGATTIFNKMLNGIGNIVKSLVDNVLGFFRNMRSNVANIVTSLQVRTAQLFMIMRTAITKTVTGLKNKAVSIFNALRNAVVNTVTNLYNRASAIFTNIYNRVAAIVQNLYNRVKSIFDRLFNVSRNIFNKLRTFLTNLWNNLRDRVTNTATNLWTRVRNTFTSMYNGLRNISNNIRNFVTRLWNNLRDRVSSTANNLWSRVKNTFNNLKRGTQNIFNSVKTYLTNKWNEIKNSVTGIASDLWSGVKGTFNKMKSGLSVIIDEIVGFIDDMTDGVKKGLNKLIDGVNFVAGKIGMDDIPKIKLSTGTTHDQTVNRTVKTTGDGALKNDTIATVGDRGPGNGPGGFRRELIQFPNGKTSLTPNRDTQTMLPRGSKVFNGKQTHAMMQGVKLSKGTNEGMFSGFGEWMGKKTSQALSGAKEIGGKVKDTIGDVWKFATNPSKLVDKILDMFGVDFDFAGGDMLGGMVKGLIGKLKAGVKNLFTGWLEDSGGGDGSSFTKFPVTTPYSPNKAVPGYPKNFNGGKHFGIDYATPVGTMLKAPNAGKVSQLNDKGGGTVAKLLSGKFTQFFMHLQDVLKTGQVKKGENFAKTGNSGQWTTGPHLHYQVEKGSSDYVTNKNTVDPDKYLAGNSAGGGSKKASAWRPQVVQALKGVGLPTSKAYQDAWIKQIDTESGGNAGITQSTAVRDINAMTGNLAKGLVQVIPPTFNAYKMPGHGNIMNGLDNLMAGMNYAKSRYGKSGMLSRIGKGMGYEKGGLLQKEGFFYGAEGDKEEMVIPLNRPTEAMKLMALAAKKIGGEGKSTSQLPNAPRNTGGSNDDVVNALVEQNGILMKMLEKLTGIEAKELSVDVNQFTKKQNRYRDDRTLLV